MNAPQLFDVVIHRDRRLIESGLTKEAAREFSRDWNRRASTENWVTWEPHRPERVLPAAPIPEPDPESEPVEVDPPAPQIAERQPTPIVTTLPADDPVIMEDPEADRGGFLPTLEEIREACRLIQATWSQAERLRRSCGWEGGVA